MTDDPERRLSAALRAQAAGMAAGFPANAVSPPAGSARRGLSVWAVLGLAVLLGALAGGLAGAISAW